MAVNNKTPDGTATNYLACVQELRKFPQIDYDNPTEIGMAIERYLQILKKHDMGPTDVTLAIALKIDTDMLAKMRSGVKHRNRETMKMLRDVKQLAEGYLQEGLLKAKNPAGYIFNLKAKYGWEEVNRIAIQDSKEVYIEDSSTIKALEQKYLKSMAIDVDSSQLKIADEIYQDEIEGEAEEIQEEQDNDD